MRYKINIDSLSTVPVVLSSSFWSGRKNIVVDGTPLKRLKEKGKPFLFERNGVQKKIYVYGLFPDLIQKIKFDDQEVQIHKKLSAVDYVLAYLPLVLVLVGGAFGGVIGGFACLLNFKIISSEKSKSVKIGLSLIVVFLSFLLWSVAATTLRNFVSHKKIESKQVSVKVNPSNLESRVSLMKNYYDAEMYDDVLRQSQVLIEQSPTNYDGLLYGAMAHVEKNKFKEALNLAEKLVRAYPNDSMGLLVLGQSYGGVKEYDKAEEVLFRCLEANPDDFRPNYLLAMAYVETGEKDKALEQYREIKRKKRPLVAAQILRVINQGHLDP